MKLSKADRERIINYCNQFRKKCNLEPVKGLKKGKQRSHTTCPIARTIGCEKYGVGRVGISEKSQRQQISRIINEHPAFIRNFIMDFDEGKYPQLELK